MEVRWGCLARRGRFHGFGALLGHGLIIASWVEGIQAYFVFRIWYLVVRGVAASSPQDLGMAEATVWLEGKARSYLPIRKASP